LYDTSPDFDLNPYFEKLNLNEKDLDLDLDSWTWIFCYFGS